MAPGRAACATIPLTPSRQIQRASILPNWETHNHSRQQTALSLGCMAAGLLLVGWFHEAPPGGSSAQAGFWFGMMLLGLGGLTLAAHARQSIVVDAQLREIRIEDRRLSGRQLRRIAFADVQDVELAYLRTRAQNTIRYFIQLQLRSGEAYALFAPERVYAGGSDPAVVAGWQNRLKALLAVPAS